MKIYKIEVSKEYEILFPDLEKGDEDINIFNLNFLPKKAKWPDMNWYSQYANLKKGNFFGYPFFSTFIFDENVFNSHLYDIIEQCCEILPINYEGRKLYLANVLQCFNVLNRKTTIWQYPNDAYKGPYSKGWILKYEFYDNREYTHIFCIPETYEVYIYCNELDYDFKKLYETNNFSGLEFNLIYSSK